MFCTTAAHGWNKIIIKKSNKSNKCYLNPTIIMWLNPTIIMWETKCSLFILKCNEVSSLNAMELEGLKLCLKILETKGTTIKNLTTDCHMWDWKPSYETWELSSFGMQSYPRTFPFLLRFRCWAISNMWMLNLQDCCTSTWPSRFVDCRRHVLQVKAAYSVSL